MTRRTQDSDTAASGHRRRRPVMTVELPMMVTRRSLGTLTFLMTTSIQGGVGPV